MRISILVLLVISAAGVDAAVNLTRHLAIVPEVRFHVYSEYGAVTRPKVAVR